MPCILIRNLPLYRLICKLKIRLFRVLERQTDHRIAPHVRKVRFPRLHDVHMFKQICIVLFTAIIRAHILKKILEHTHIERLAKTPRTRK